MAASPPKPRTRWRPWKILLALFVFTVLLFFGYLWFTDWSNNARLQAAIAATDKLDPHWRLADLEAEYQKLPVSKHFGPRLLVWKGYRGWFGDDIGERPGVIPYDRTGKHYNVRFPESYFEILKERLIESDENPLKLIREELKGLMNEPYPSQIPYTNNDLVSRTRAVINHLLDETEYAAHEGRHHEIVSYLDKQLRLCRHLHATPRLINQLVGMAIFNVSMTGIKRAMALGVVPHETLIQLQELLTVHDQSLLIQVLRIIRAEEFDHLEQAKKNEIARKQLRDQLTTTINLPSKTSSVWDKPRYYWSLIESELELYDLPNAQTAILELIANTIEKAKTDPERTPSFVRQQLNKLKEKLSRDTCAVTNKLASAELTRQAELRSLLLAIACERYRLATGVWPKSLNDVVPSYIKEIPHDPYSGQPMLYKQLPDGVVIYSVHTNGVDDGGMVLYLDGKLPLDRGTKLFNPELRGKKYEELKENE